MNDRGTAAQGAKPLALVIDDDPYLSKVLCYALRMNRFRCTTAPTGSDGVKAVAKRRPDVILLDLLLPDMDGFEVVTRIQQISPVPILVMTALPEARNKVKALGLGAHDFLSKPFDLDEMVGKVNALIGREE